MESPGDLMTIKAFSEAAGRSQQTIYKQIQTRLASYVHEKDGQKFSKVSIVANNVQLLGGRDGGQTGSNPMAGGASSFQPKNSFGPSASAPVPDYGSAPFGGTGDDFPEDIPF